jgi:hypothetical protein
VVFGLDGSTDEGKRAMSILNVKRLPVIQIRIAVNDMIPYELNIIVDIKNMRRIILRRRQKCSYKSLKGL